MFRYGALPPKYSHLFKEGKRKHSFSQNAIGRLLNLSQESHVRQH